MFKLDVLEHFAQRLDLRLDREILSNVGKVPRDRFEVVLVDSLGYVRSRHPHGISIDVQFRLPHAGGEVDRTPILHLA